MSTGYLVPRDGLIPLLATVSPSTSPKEPIVVIVIVHRDAGGLVVIAVPPHQPPRDTHSRCKRHPRGYAYPYPHLLAQPQNIAITTIPIPRPGGR